MTTMVKNRSIQVLLILFLVITNISCDQVSKKIVRNSIRENEMIHLANEHITLTNVENTGAFLSTGSSLPGTAKHILLSFIPMLAIILGLIYILSKQDLNRSLLVGFCFVIG